jgi:hypothetical protein
MNAQGVFAITTHETCHDLSQAAWSTKHLMNIRLQNKRALVSCGSRGNGAAIVRRLAHEGSDKAEITQASNRQ